MMPVKLKFPSLALAVVLLRCASTSALTDPVEKDFIYKKTPQGELKLVVTLPPDARPGNKRPAIVFFSGGAWANSNIKQFKDLASYLAHRGMVAVRVDYRVSKSHNVGPDKCVEDARSAVRWVREHAAELGIDPDRVAASGASAGGHLAACTATPVAPDAETDNLKVSCAPNALVLINCVADFTPGGLTARAGGAEMARRISPVLHVSTKTPPTLIMDGSEDNWVTTAKQFTDKATALGVRCEFYIAEGKGHQFCGRSPWREATIRTMDEFLISLGWLTGPPAIEMPNAVAWVRYQPDPSAKPSGNISPPTIRRAKAPAKPEAAAADPKTDSKEDRRAEFLKRRRLQRKAGTPAPKPEAASQKPEAAADISPAPSAPAPTDPPSGSVAIQITSDKAVPVNPRVYGTWCEEMFSKGLVNEPEYIAALVDLKFKTFLYPGGSLSYYHHPKGPGGFNIRPEELARSKYGEQGRAMKEKSGPGGTDLGAAIMARYLKGNSEPDYLGQFIRFVKASGGEAVFVANILNGTVEELDEFLTRLKAERVPIAAVVLGVEMHLGPAQALGLDGYVERIKPYIAMLKAKCPDVPIVAHSTPVGRAVELARASFHEWNQTLGRLPGISGFSQYGWTEFAGQPRLQTRRGGSTAQTPAETWRQYDEFVRTFPSRQIATYQKDWGNDKKMFLTQWGTHADHNTAVQGLHIANFYFFLAQYNAAHDDYFAVATSSVNLMQDVSKYARGGGTLYREKIELLTPYLYTKPFRHLFGGDKKLLAATVQDVGKEEAIKVLAAVGADDRKYVYLLNSGPAVALGRLSVDGAALPAGARVEVESVCGASAPARTLTGQRNLRDIVLEPFSLTLLITPNDVSPVDRKQPPKHATEQNDYDKAAGPRPDLEDVSYGSHERLKLDLWKAKSSQPTPVLVFFHGGGGDKLMYRGNPLLTLCLSNGISAGAVNYRPNHLFPAPVPMQDAGRAIQFLRSKAGEFNLDPKRVAAFGTSLGANVSISLAYGDDLADPKSNDPILHASSRLCFLITADAGGGFGGRVGHRPAATEKNAASEPSAKYQITKDDPPILMIYKMPLKQLASLKDTPKRELLHNPVFGQLLKQKLDAAGVESYLYHGGNKAPPDAEQKFILKHFFGTSAQLPP